MSRARAVRFSRAGRRSAPAVCRQCVCDVLGLRFPRAALLWPRCVYGGSWCCRSRAPIRVPFFARGPSYSTSWGRGACTGSARSRCAACAALWLKCKGPCLYVCTDGSRRACGVGACARLVATLGAPRETFGPRFDRISLARPPCGLVASAPRNYFWPPVRVPLISLDS